jgi:hypothetical protein
MVPGRSIRSAPLAALGALATAASLAACGGGGDKPVDAAPDTPVDMAPGTCGAGQVLFTGELVDWNNAGAVFCGVNKATLTVRGQAAQTDQTNPNGRFELCIASQALTLVDVAQAAGPSQCTAIASPYPVSLVLVAEAAVIAGAPLFSARVMTQDTMDKMFGTIGQPYSASQGQLVVHVVGTPRAVTISTASHAATQRFDGTAWAAGNVGSDVFFPNVDVAGGAIQVDVAGGATGTTSVTLEAGKLTYLDVIAL